MRGLEQASELASPTQARVRLLNVLDDSLLVLAAYAHPARDIDEAVDSLWASGRKVLDRAVALVGRHGIEPEPVQLRSGVLALAGASPKLRKNTAATASFWRHLAAAASRS